MRNIIMYRTDLPSLHVEIVRVIWWLAMLLFATSALSSVPAPQLSEGGASSVQERGQPAQHEFISSGCGSLTVWISAPIPPDEIVNLWTLVVSVDHPRGFPGALAQRASALGATFADLPVGQYRVVVHTGESVLAHVFRNARTDVLIEINKVERLRGNVTHEGGEKSANANIVVIIPGDLPFRVVVGKTNEHGAFETWARPSMRVSAVSGSMCGDWTTVTDSKNKVEICLRRRGSTAVVRANGLLRARGAVRWAAVCLEGTDLDAPAIFVLPDRIDAVETAIYSGLRGRVRVAYVSGHGSTLVLQGTADGEQSAVGSIVIDVPITREIGGRVVSPSGRPVAGARVALLASGYMHQSTFADGDGMFVFTQVPEKSKVIVQADSGEPVAGDATALAGRRDIVLETIAESRESDVPRMGAMVRVTLHKSGKVGDALEGRAIVLAGATTMGGRDEAWDADVAPQGVIVNALFMMGESREVEVETHRRVVGDLLTMRAAAAPSVLQGVGMCIQDGTPASAFVSWSNDVGEIYDVRVLGAGSDGDAKPALIRLVNEKSVLRSWSVRDESTRPDTGSASLIVPRFGDYAIEVVTCGTSYRVGRSRWWGGGVVVLGVGDRILEVRRR